MKQLIFIFALLAICGCKFTAEVDKKDDVAVEEKAAPVAPKVEEKKRGFDINIERDGPRKRGFNIEIDRDAK